MSYEALDWDSEFFGFPIGRVGDGRHDPKSLGNAVRAADKDAISCLYFLCPTDEDDALASALNLGFRPYDVRIELGMDLEGAPAKPSSAREARPEDAAPLEAIARQQLRDTRFGADPGFPRERVADLYATWLQRGLSTAPERRTLVVGESEGFVICHFDKARGLGTIELIAVAAGAERRGHGRELLAAADGIFADAGLRSASVVTQARNVAAQRLYQHHGYRTTHSGLWLHRWSRSSREVRR